MKVYRGEIVYLYKEAYEQIEGAGNLQVGMRPLLVVSNDIGNKYSNICIVVPLTTKNKRGLPTHALIKMNQSVVMCEQLFTINQSDISRVAGMLTEKEMRKVNNCLKVSLALERG